MNNQFKLQINSIFKSRTNEKHEIRIFHLSNSFIFFFFSNFHENTYQSIRKIRITSQTFQLSASLLSSKKKFLNSQDFEEPFHIPPFHFQKHISRSANINIHHLSSFHFQKHVPAQDHANNFHSFQPRITFLDPRETQVSRPTQTPSIIKTAASNRFPAEGKKTSCGNRTSLDTRLIDDLSRPFLCPETLRIPSEKLRRLDGIRSWKSGRLREII